MKFIFAPSNHFHCLLFPTHTGTSVNQMIGECKRFMAYDIVKALEKRKCYSLLEVLSKNVPPRERRIGKLHQVFFPSFDSRICYDEKMIEQKLEYIHHNPVKGKWSFVEDFVEYQHSSARFYELNELIEGVELEHYKDITGE